MSAAKEFLRLSQQDLTTLDTAPPTEAGNSSQDPTIPTQEISPQPHEAVKEANNRTPAEPRQQVALPQDARVPSIAPNSAFLAMLQGKKVPADTAQASAPVSSQLPAAPGTAPVLL